MILNKITYKIAIPVNCKLGEGLHWDEKLNSFWFVDILEKCLYIFNLDTLELKSRKFDETVSWVVSLEKYDSILVGFKSGIAYMRFFDPDFPIVWVNKDFPGRDDLRLNDAKVDKFGRIWYGSISTYDENLNVGALVRYDFESKTLKNIDSNYKVTNGPAFNSDNSIMLHNDSGNRITYKFVLDTLTGEIINKFIWKVYGIEYGYPDGMNFDSEDNVWIAHWGVGKVCKYNLEGNLLQEIKLPTPNITNVCFGGKDLSRIFVTSAAPVLNNTENIKTIYDGAVFEILGANVKGVKNNLPKFNIV